jgi:hypothetical protein
MRNVTKATPTDVAMKRKNSGPSPGAGVCALLRVDTNDVVQLICEHPSPTSSQALGDTSGVGLGWKPRAAEL